MKPSLGRTVRKPIPNQLDVVESPAHLDEVTLNCTEFTSHCPVTNQPDFSRVQITYKPSALIVESKSLKLYLWSFRSRGLFAEMIAERIAADFLAAVKPYEVIVTVVQAPRGGIQITASAVRKLSELRA